jgi:peptidoglycan/LPS O-acetylase OafA/YrhL
MVAVVLMHCYPIKLLPVTENHPLFLQVGFQLAKFATIAFFLIGGYLVGERLPECSREVYLWRRVRRLGLPWLAWFGLFCAMLALGHWLFHYPATLAPTAAGFLATSLFGSAYWFIPNMLFGLSVLLAVSRSIDDWCWGVVLLLPAVFYAINIYVRLVDTRHATAFTGFVGYFWLGAWAARNWSRVAKLLSAAPIMIWAGLSLILLLLGVCETRTLVFLHSPEGLNTLRFSNQLYSASVVLLFLKITVRTWPSFLNVREHTFGIYLTHTPVNAVVGFALQHSALMRIIALHAATGLACLWVVRFAFTYALSATLTLLIAQSSLRRLIGARQPEHARMRNVPQQGTPVSLSLRSQI